MFRLFAYAVPATVIALATFAVATTVGATTHPPDEVAGKATVEAHLRTSQAGGVVHSSPRMALKLLRESRHALRRSHRITLGIVQHADAGSIGSVATTFSAAIAVDTTQLTRIAERARGRLELVAADALDTDGRMHADVAAALYARLAVTPDDEPALVGAVVDLEASAATQIRTLAQAVGSPKLRPRARRLVRNALHAALRAALLRRRMAAEVTAHAQPSTRPVLQEIVDGILEEVRRAASSLTPASRSDAWVDISADAGVNDVALGANVIAHGRAR